MTHHTLREQEVPLGTLKRVVVAGRALCLAHLSDGFYALDNVCTNSSASLAAGAILENRLLECPRNGCTFDVRTGAAVGLPAVLPLQTYPVRVENGTIVVDLPPHA